MLLREILSSYGFSLIFSAKAASNFLKPIAADFILNPPDRVPTRTAPTIADDALGGCVRGILRVYLYDLLGETLMKNDQSRSMLPALKRRVAYSLAAGAAAGAAGVGTSEVQGQIVYSGPYPINISQFGSLNLDLDEYGASPDIKLKNYVFNGNYMGATVLVAPGQLVLSNNSYPFYVSALSSGDLIDATTVGPVFYGSMAYANDPNSEFNNTPDGYIGLSFPSGANLFYGWVRVAVDRSAGTFLVKEWAYNSVSGAEIRAGQIPEPSTLGMLAAGSAGLIAMRRRKKAA